jgi:hypothetical protein
VYAQDSFDDAFSNPSSTPSCLVDSFQRHETLLIFDYDDTLFPTSFLSQNGYKLDGPDASPEIQAILDEYSIVVEQTLLDAQEHGQIVIVTNAESGWITLTSQKFMPRLGQLLESYPITHQRHQSSLAETFYHSATLLMSGTLFIMFVRTRLYLPMLEPILSPCTQRVLSLWKDRTYHSSRDSIILFGKAWTGLYTMWVPLICVSNANLNRTTLTRFEISIFWLLHFSPSIPYPLY